MSRVGVESHVLRVRKCSKHTASVTSRAFGVIGTAHEHPRVPPFPL